MARARGGQRNHNWMMTRRSKNERWEVWFKMIGIVASGGGVADQGVAIHW